MTDEEQAEVLRLTRENNQLLLELTSQHFSPRPVSKPAKVEGEVAAESANTDLLF